MKPRYKKLLSMLLTAAMVFNIGLPVFAEGTAPPGISGICTHHVEHTEDCGYQQGTPCDHTHTEDCYTKELTCRLIEGDASEIATDSEATHTHDEDCYTQIKKCKHKHTVNVSEADRDGLLGGDEDCGYTPGSPCTFDPADCTQCNPGDTPTEKSCTCDPVLGAGDAGHDEDCPLYTVPELSEAVKALIRMVDALPGADTITGENRERVKSDFDAAWTAYEALSDDDKAAFEATVQRAKLMALYTVLCNAVLLANSTVHDIGTGNLTLDNTCGEDCTHTVTGTSTGGTIIVDGGTHNVTLDDVTIDVSSTENSCAFEITGGATVNLTLTDANTLESGTYKAGLQVPAGNKLTITDESTGSLQATGGWSGAGIGSGNSGAGGNSGTGGNITISGGTVTATGGNLGAGIGGGNEGAGGTITISGGTVTATGGNLGAGIGGGLKGSGGTVTIGGNAVVFATKDSHAPHYIGAGNDATGGTVTKTSGIVFEGTGGLLYGTNVTPTSSFTIPSSHLLKVEPGKALTINPPITVTNNGTIVNGGSISGAITGNQPVDLNPATHDISTALLVLDSTCGSGTCQGHTVTGDTARYKIIVESGTHNVTLSSVKIDVNAAEEVCAFEIAGGAAVNLTLTGENTLYSGENRAGLQASTGATLVITEESTGSLDVVGGNLGAGIGGGNAGSGGTITISGGTVTATGGGNGAGIGGGHISAGGVITISGGAVTAIGGENCAGIGGSGWGSAGGTITIDGNALVYAQTGLYASNHIGAGGNAPGGPVTKTRGIVFEGESGDVYGSATLTKSLTVTESQTLTVNAGATLTIPEGITLQNDGVIYNHGGTINGKVGKNPAIVPNAGDHLLTTGDLTITGECQGGCKGHKVIGRTTTHKIVVNGGTHNITLDDVKIDVSAAGQESAFEIEGGAVVNLTLTGENTLHSGENRAGLQVSADAELVINKASTGSLDAVGGDRGAGIGNGINDPVGSVTISGGTVTATGGVGGAGIGSGSSGSGGSITIDGNAVVFAQRGSSAPNHIGAGRYATGGTVARTQGVIFEGDSGAVYGSVTLTKNLTFTESQTLTVNAGTTLNIPESITLQNNGAITGTGFVYLLRASSVINGTGTGNDTHVKRLLQEDNTTISNTTYGTPPVVTWDGVTLTANTDFTVGNITTGASVPVTVTGVGDYRGSVTKNIAVDAGSGGGSTGSGVSGSGSTSTTLIPNQLSTAQSNAAIITDENGIVTAKADDQDILNAIETAQKSEKQNGIAITLNVQTKENTNSLEVTLSAATVAALSNAKVTQFTIHNGLTGITFDLTALGALAGGEVKLTISQVDGNSLSAEAVNAIGSRPVFRFGASVDGRAVTDFKSGRVSLQMPYIRSTAEQTGNLCGVYVDDNGKVTWLENSSYDSITGNMLASATHFSIYGVGYKQNTPGFTDVDTHWAKNDIDFVVTRGLLTGTGSTTFAPDTGVSRGMFVTALGRLAEVDTQQYSSTRFTDVNADAYYAPYVAWADANGIVNGTTDTTFSPDNAITRQEMAVMVVNYSKAIGYKLPVTHNEIIFTDAGSIDTWVKDAVKQMQTAGLIIGKSGNRFDPTATATRAEVSAMLRRYVELVVNTRTAEGWIMNESGQWMYIENGKRTIGQKTIDGTKYTFDQYGVV